MRRAGWALLLLSGIAFAQYPLIEYSPDEVFIMGQRIDSLEEVYRAEADIEILAGDRRRLEKLLGELDAPLDADTQEAILEHLDRADDRANVRLEKAQSRHDEIQAYARQFEDRYSDTP